MREEEVEYSRVELRVLALASIPTPDVGEVQNTDWSGPNVWSEAGLEPVQWVKYETGQQTCNDVNSLCVHFYGARLILQALRYLHICRGEVEVRTYVSCSRLARD